MFNELSFSYVVNLQTSLCFGKKINKKRIQRYLKYTLNSSQVLSLLDALKSVTSFSLYDYLREPYYYHLCFINEKSGGQNVQGHLAGKW